MLTRELWDRKSPINGVPAEEVLRSRTDIPPGGEIYLIKDGEQVVYFQPHEPGVSGIKAMTKANAERIAKKHLAEIQERFAGK